MDERFETNMELVDSATPKEETPSPAETPVVETKKEEAPADPTPEVPVEAKPETPLFDTPDGRKVDAATLTREWKENFLPEFTRKSQELARIEREREINNPKDDTPAWKKPDYVPENYAEVIELAKREALQEIQNSHRAEEERVASVQREVDNQLSEVKAIDPKLDENALFVHANKYGFRDLKAAHANMTDMAKVRVEVEQRTLKNVKTREADPISTGHGGESSPSDGYDPNKMSAFAGAAEYLEFIKGKK